MSLSEYIEYSEEKFFAKRASDIKAILTAKPNEPLNKAAVAKIIRFIFNEYNFEVPKDIIAEAIKELDFESVKNSLDTFLNLQNPKDLLNNKIKPSHALILKEAGEAAFAKLKRIRKDKEAPITNQERGRLLERI